MNPISKIKQYNEALKLLNDAGYEGDLLNAVIGALTLNDQMAVHLADYNKLADQLKGMVMPAEGIPSGDVAVRTYFVPYLFEATEFHNGGRVRSGSGMTMVHIAGGIRDWNNIVSLTEFIKGTALQPLNLPNAKVTIIGLNEIK